MENKKVQLLANNLKRILKDRNMERLQKKLYEFIHLNCGFIAHYDLNGFKATYYDGDEYVGFLERLKQGCSNIYACDLEDNYNYGYTNKEVKEALAELLTDEVIATVKSEVAQQNKNERYEEYQRLKVEFGGA